MVAPPVTDTDFEDIRPYRDHEIHDVLNRIRKHPWILAAFRRYLWPDSPQSLEKTIENLLKVYLGFKLLRIHSVDDFHKRFFRKTVLDAIYKRTISGLYYTNFDYIDRAGGCLFITNHRDIVLDSAFLAYGLMKIHMQTPEIAFGDNLLINPFVSDLIRINKGFLVRRNLAVKEQITESLKLSKYIQYTLAQKRSIWLAQKGGRAKDGNDRTNTTIIKMIYLSQVKGGMDFSTYINECKIVPVAISYEYDPCDLMKAKEIYISRTKGKYKKSPREDLVSILRGINEPKGRVHYTFCPQLQGEWESPQQVAETIDRSIIEHYFLWPSNYVAYDLVKNTDKFSNRYTSEEKSAFLQRFAKLSEGERQTAIEIYARPALNKKEYGIEP